MTAKYIHANALPFVLLCLFDKGFQNKRECIAAQGAVVTCKVCASPTGKENVRFNYFVMSTGGHQ